MLELEWLHRPTSIGAPCQPLPYEGDGDPTETWWSQFTFVFFLLDVGSAVRVEFYKEVHSYYIQGRGEPCAGWSMRSPHFACLPPW